LATRLPTELPGGVVDDADGLRIDWPDAWVQVRASNTEPIVRIFAESQDPARAEALCATVRRLMG
ncbi:MAG: phosphoglucosamine mutase, partial [Planctomycetia bacterium]